MKAQVLIESVVQQTTVLIAKLATAGGLRAPLAHIANQVFVDLASELERQGLGRKVTADMFGISLRAYQRKMHRLRESSTERGQSLWEAVLAHLRSQAMVTRQGVLERFPYDEEESLRGILHDLVESGLVFCTGSGPQAVYRAASDAELGALSQLESGAGLPELVWSLIFSHGPIGEARLASLSGLQPAALGDVLSQLIASDRIEFHERNGERVLGAERFYIDPDATVGWEASVFDHFHAVVRTICNRLEGSDLSPRFSESIGGSTYTFEVGPGHPYEARVLGLLKRYREECSALRREVGDYNGDHGSCNGGENVVFYLGQSVIPREDEQGASAAGPAAGSATAAGKGKTK